MNWQRKMESTEISILHIRSGLPLQDRLPVWQEARQLTPVVFNYQFLALNFAPFVLSFCCFKANPAQQQSVSGRWLPFLMDSCPHLKNQHRKCLQKILTCFACGVWTWVIEVLWEEVLYPQSCQTSNRLVAAETEMSIVASKRSPAPSSTGKEIMVATRVDDINH